MTPAQQACLDDGGHFWPTDTPPGDNYVCRRCQYVGARNWPTINEANG